MPCQFGSQNLSRSQVCTPDKNLLDWDSNPLTPAPAGTFLAITRQLLEQEN